MEIMEEEKSVISTWTMSYNQWDDENYLKPANKEVDISGIDFKVNARETLRRIFNTDGI